MKIAVIGTHGEEEHPSTAIGSTLRELCPRLADRGHEIDVFSEPNGRSFQPIPGAHLITIPRLPFALREGGSHAMVSSLLSICRGYDVVNFFAAEASGLYSLAARLGGHRTVVSIHGPDDNDVSVPPKGWRKMPQALAARFADAITVSSRRLERLFRETYNREAIYIPNGINLPNVTPDPQRLALLNLERESYLLFAGELTPESGAHLAIAAVNGLPPGKRLVIAETAEGDHEYRRQLWLNAHPERVLFVGQVAPPLLDALVRHAYLYLLPGLAETSPGKLLEGLAHGRAVVVSDLAENMDVVGPDAFTFTSGDIGDLKRILSWLLNDPEIVIRMQVRAAAGVASRYCWDRVADTYELVYKALL